MLLAACGDGTSSLETTTDGESDTDSRGEGGRDDEGTVDDPGPSAEGTPPPASLKKLRSFEYQNTIDALFGPTDLTTPLPEDLVRANFTSVSAAQDCYDPRGVEDLEALALEAAALAFANTPTPLEATGCSPTDASDPCIRDFVSAFGLQAWRRPLTPSELDKYVDLLGTLASIYDGDLVKGTELTVAAVLESPHFVYRVELGTPIQDDTSHRKYDDYEMASRLAYTLWESPPDAELLAAAAAGDLGDAQGVRAQALRMLDDPQSIDAIFRFWREHLGIDRLTLINYPRAQATPSLYAAMREEGHFMAYNLALPGADALSFIDTDVAYLHPELADLYGIDLEHEAEVNMPMERRGYLTSAAFLVSTGHPGKTSPTRRGKFVLDRVLCRVIPPPPADVDLELPEVAVGQATRRELVEMHASDPACNGCHRLLDPPGFAFEQYGPMGGFRSEDNGLPIDPSGEMDGMPFQDANDLIDILPTIADTSRCVVKQTFRSALGIIDENGQRAYIDAMTATFEANGHNQREIIADMMASDAFRYATGFAGATEANTEEME